MLHFGSRELSPNIYCSGIPAFKNYDYDPGDQYQYKENYKTNKEEQLVTTNSGVTIPAWDYNSVADAQRGDKEEYPGGQHGDTIYILCTRDARRCSSTQDKTKSSPQTKGQVDGRQGHSSLYQSESRR